MQSRSTANTPNKVKGILFVLKCYITILPQDDLNDLDDFMIGSEIFGAMTSAMWNRDMLASMIACEIDAARGLPRRSQRLRKLSCVAMLTLLQEAIDVYFEGGTSIICSIATEQRLKQSEMKENHCKYDGLRSN